MKHILILALLSSFSLASDGLNRGDSAWMLVATAFVMLMTPAGLALFYGGMTKSKNVLNTIGLTLISFGVGTITWIIAGYGIAFGDGDFYGSTKILLSGITPDSLSGSIPEFLFVAFQGTFAAIAVAIASGSMIERVKLSTFTIFAALWIVLVYAPITHWTWGGGSTLNFGEMDFAGGTVVHINAGVAGFVVAMLLGKRISKSEEKPFSPVFTVLGAILLWFGWFGFNAGSALASDGVASSAFLVTNIAASAGLLSWIAIEWFSKKKATLIGGATGAISGLVAITPAAGSAGVVDSIIIGFIGALIGFISVSKIKGLFKVDDSLDAFWIHGTVGIWGSIATAILIAPYFTPEGYSISAQLINQLKAIGLTIVYSALGTMIVFYISSLITGGARIDAEIEELGIDANIHGEAAVNI